jgi:glycosyltransferase involved in cell wall biosynthesis
MNHRVDIISPIHSSESYQDYTTSTSDLSAVTHTFQEHDSNEYLHTARHINSKRYQTVFLQLEFGLYDMDSLLCMLREMKVHRLYTILHTVQINLLETEHSWLQQVAFLSTKLIVLSHTMRHLLTVYHGIPTRDIIVIPHGGPTLPYERYDLNTTALSPSLFSLSSPTTPSPLAPYHAAVSTLPPLALSMFVGKKIILSNGLIHPKKGFELMIRAMPRVLSVIPNALYVISGIPHPMGVGCEDYYHSLVSEANTSTATSIFFDHSYRSDEELSLLLRHSHLYVNPYTNKEQAVSGTLTMALSVGTISISSPYPYAREVLRNGIGRLVPFHSVESLADAVIEMLNQTDSWHEQRTREIHRSSQEKYSWKKIAEQYLELP